MRYLFWKGLKKVASSAALTLVVGSFFAVPMVSALDIELDTSGIEEEICDAIDGPEDEGVLQCDTDSDSSFTNFEGDFSPPEEDGYAEGITTTSSAREFIVNVTNFVLGFLGLAAVIVIIYGGFLYVTAGGEQEQADKGRKSVQYAVMGIIVVLISYALVNTIISGAAVGEDVTDSNGGLYTSGDVSGDSTTEFQSSQMAGDVEDIAQAFLEEYTAFVNTSAILEAMAQVGTFDESGLNEMDEGYDLILSEVQSFSNTADVTRAAQQSIHNYVSFNFTEKLKVLVGYSEWAQASIIQVFEVEEPATMEAADGGGDGDAGVDYDADGSDEDIPPFEEPEDPEDPPADPPADDPTATTDSDVDPYGVGTDVLTSMTNISSVSVTDFQAHLEELSIELTSMQGSVEGLATLNVLFENALTQMDSYQTASYTSTNYTVTGVSGTATIYGDPYGSSVAGELIDTLNQIHAAIQDLEFTTAVISANTDEGNMPLIVTFNGLDSYDPSDLTIPDENYEWDLLGVGFEDPEIDIVTGPSATHTYEEPGTYRVALRVNSTSDEIASGISYLSIKVNPPSSIIALTGTTSVTTADLTDTTTWTVTREEANAGITFNASGTTDGEGNTDSIVDYSFSFGDGESESGETPSAQHFYSSEGTYPFVLEVTDQNGMTDRKIIDLVVASPAAHLESTSQTLQIGESATFDASGSMTDNGNIEQYTWTITKSGVTVYTIEDGDDSLTYTFNEPGTYTVEISVTDAASETNSTSTTVEVASTPPVAVFSYEIPDDRLPNRVHLDASNSYDPDPNDTLTYAWVLEGTEGTDYAFAQGTNAASGKPVVDFYEVGEWSVSVTASDQYEESLQQSTSFTSDVTVTSILTIESETQGSMYALLDESGKASVSLSLTSSTGVAYEIDWADGSAIETVPVTTVGTAQVATHTYYAGGTYTTNIVVYDEDRNTNERAHNVFIGNGQTPIPIITVSVDGLDQSSVAEVSGTRVSGFTFSAEESVDVDGTSLSPANFSWNLGDGTTLTNQRSVTREYDEVGTFEVSLKVDSRVIQGASATTTLTVTIEPASPEVYTITIDPLDTELITPLQVKVDVNAEDEDGEISQYKFWYYDVNNSSEAFETTISSVPSAILTLNNNGDTGELTEYGFAVEVIDDENNKTNSMDVLTSTQIPTIEVENGPNQAPVAEFSVDRTNIIVGESVTFTSLALDEDGEIMEYQWDFEGDGFYNNDSTTLASTTYSFDSSAPTGIEVRLKVVDDGGATGISDPIRIYVDSLTDDPEAAFTYVTGNLTVTFTNNSTADTQNGAEISVYEWDFDTSIDSDGNGVKDDDIDSNIASPTHLYTEYDAYSVSLKITDNEGNTDTVTQNVTIVETDPPVAAFTYSSSDLTATFINNSNVAGVGINLSGYSWDFDTSEDMDGNGVSDDDIDSTEKSPIHVYEDYGTHTVKLTITDSIGRTDEVTQTIKLEELETELIAYLTSSPAADPSDGKIHLTGTSGNVTFSYSSAGASGTVNYCIDKNVYFDSDGDGDKDNDCNGSATSAGSYTTDFDESWGLIVVKLMVTDDTDRTDSVSQEIKFDEESTGSASLLPVTTPEALYILATALAFTILGAKLYTRKETEEEL